MKIVPFQRLACPLDALPLHREQSAWVCGNGHSFDIASKGYTHLLPVQHKRSRDPGDSKEMVAARRRFLGAGFYQRIARAVSEAVFSGVESSAALSCLDAGCGEGYYLREMCAASTVRTLSLLGLDISKWAVQAAARQDKRPAWIVGSNARIPVQPDAIDRILCLFGFPVYPEFVRVLKPGGLLIQVDAGPDHLQELREVIYQNRRPSRAADNRIPVELALQSTESVNYPIALGGDGMILDLLAMTPHYHRASAEARARLTALEALSVTVDVRVATYRYQPGAEQAVTRPDSQ